MSKTETQSEALRLALEFEICEDFDINPSIIDAAAAAAELRRLDAENKALRADAERYRFIKRHRLILSGGTEKFGWPIAPFGDECDRYIAQELAAEREAQAAAKKGGAA